MSFCSCNNDIEAVLVQYKEAYISEKVIICELEVIDHSYESRKKRPNLETTYGKRSKCYGNRRHFQCVCFLTHSLQDLLEVLVSIMTGPERTVKDVDNDQVATAKGGMLNVDSEHIKPVWPAVLVPYSHCLTQLPLQVAIQLLVAASRKSLLTADGSHFDVGILVDEVGLLDNQLAMSLLQGDLYHIVINHKG